MREVILAPHVQDYIVRLVLATHPGGQFAVPITNQYLRWGASPRGAQTLALAAKVRALLDGRYNVSFEDVRRVYLPALRHRVILNFEAQAEGIETDQVLLEILEKVPEKATDEPCATHGLKSSIARAARPCRPDRRRCSEPELLAQLERLELVSRKIFRGRMKGERRSTRKGQSVEFADFRNYVPGDDLRFIDWNTYARLDRLFLKLFLEEEDLHFYALIDASPSMDFGEPTKLHYAKQLAAALGFVGLVRGDRVRIETLGQPAGEPGPVFRGRRSVWRMLEYLRQHRAGPKPCRWPQGVKNFCLRNSRQGHRRADQRPDGQGGLRDGAPVPGVAADGRVRDPRALGRGARSGRQGRPAAGRLRRRATWPRSRVSRPLLERYKKTLAAFVEGAREFCTRRGMNYLLASNQVPVEQLVTELSRAARAGAMMSFINMLSLVAVGCCWRAVPPAIVLLYFLKLKRQPLEVPSTYLWRKSIEDLHVNSIWQRLRQSLLLFLQLLLVLLVMAALVRPGWSGSQLVGDRFIFLVDNSASMQATDVEPIAAGRGQAPRGRTDRPDGLRRRGDDRQLCRRGPGRAGVHRQSPRAPQRASRRSSPRTAPRRWAKRCGWRPAWPTRGAPAMQHRCPGAEGLPATLYIFSDGKFPDVAELHAGQPQARLRADRHSRRRRTSASRPSHCGAARTTRTSCRPLAGWRTSAPRT